MQLVVSLWIGPFSTDTEKMLRVSSVVYSALRKCTIFALSSGSLPCAIAVIRISGAESKMCMQKLTHREKFAARKLFYTKVFDANGELVDRAMAAFLPGPSTFTGEDTAEIYVHGSRAVVDCVCCTLDNFRNVRAAKAGEFTRRAFFNSRMSLHEVESLSYLLSAETQSQRKLAVGTSVIGAAAAGIREKLLSLLCTLEAGIDFADDVSLDLEAIRARARDILDNLLLLRRRVRRGSLISGGVRVVILGCTNVGKSSLLNLIAEREVAIVSNVEGTTRDALETRIELGCVPVILTDTAGVRTAADFLEAEGISRTVARAREADVVLVVVDMSLGRNVAQEVRSLLAACEVRAETVVLVVCNKCDKAPESREEPILPWKVFFTSCVRREGIDLLVDGIENEIKALCSDDGNEAVLSRHRHRVLLSEAISLLWDAVEETQDDAALLAQFVNEAAQRIGEISGAIVNEEILDNIFSSFCIGK